MCYVDSLCFCCASKLVQVALFSLLQLFKHFRVWAQMCRMYKPLIYSFATFSDWKNARSLLSEALHFFRDVNEQLPTDWQQFEIESGGLRATDAWKKDETIVVLLVTCIHSCLQRCCSRWHNLHHIERDKSTTNQFEMNTLIHLLIISLQVLALAHFTLALTRPACRAVRFEVSADEGWPAPYNAGLTNYSFSRWAARETPTEPLMGSW